MNFIAFKIKSTAFSCKKYARLKRVNPGRSHAVSAHESSACKIFSNFLSPFDIPSKLNALKKKNEN